MSSPSPRPAHGGAVRLAVVSGLVLVAYGLTLATWVSSSDSSTGFLDLSYGDPPYGFKDPAWSEVIARPYFNGGAWVLLASVALLVGVALLTRVPIATLGAQAMALLAVAWSLATLVTLALIDLQLGAFLPTIGYAIVSGAILIPTASRRRSADNSLLTGALGAVVFGAGIIALAEGDTGATSEVGVALIVTMAVFPTLAIAFSLNSRSQCIQAGARWEQRAIIGLALGSIAVISIMLIWGYANLHQNTA
jgi:hypothetical protein